MCWHNTPPAVVCVSHRALKKSPMDLIGAFVASHLADVWCFQQRIGRGPKSALGSKRWELPLSSESLGGVLKEILFVRS